MILTILNDDGVVGIDKVFRSVDLSALDPNIHAVQWNGSMGTIEYKNSIAFTTFNELDAFTTFITAWNDAAPLALTLSDWKAEKRAEFTQQGIIRITMQVPEWDDFKRIAMIASIWNMLGTPNAAQVLARDIYVYVRNTAIPKVNAASSQSELDAIDPSAADPFGDGTLWPT